MKCDKIPMIDHKMQVVNGDVKALEGLIREYARLPSGELTLGYEKEGNLGFLHFEWNGLTLSGREASLTVQFPMVGAVGVASTALHLSRIINNFLNQYDVRDPSHVAH